jgi:hypothetical protein
MIMIERKLDEVIYITPRNDCELPVEILQLFDYGPIGISIEELSNDKVKLGICIPDELEAVKKEESK